MGWYSIFPQILNMSLTTSIVILFVLAVRLFLKKAPKIISYALWGVVLFRLLCPVSVTTDISLFSFFNVPAKETSDVVSQMEYVPTDIVHTANPEVSLPIPVVNEMINDTLPQGREQLGADPLEAPISFATYIWLAGIASMLLYSTITYFKLKNKLVGSIPLRDNIVLSDYIASPFVLGLFRPKIYLPSALSEKEQKYIILHEQHHIKRFDHIIKALAFLALCIHWFNPLVWLSFALSGRDMEMSCDEAVVKKLGTEIRADYTASLLSLATGHRIIAGTPLAFGEGDTKERIKNLVNWKKPAFWVTILAVVSCSILAVCLLTNPSIRRDTLKFTGQNQRGRTCSVDFETNFGNQVKNGTIFAEQWYNGECVRSSSVALTQYVEELHILMNIRHDGERQSGVDIQIDTDEYGGSLLTYFAFPDDRSFIGWSFESYGLGDKLEVTSGEERILAAMAFDDGHGVRSIDLDELVSNPERLKETGYMVVIRAFFYEGELGSQNNEPVSACLF